MERATSINGAVLRRDELAGLTSIASWFGLSAAGAEAEFASILAVTDRWRQIAAGNGIGEAELDRFAPVFDDLQAATELNRGGRTTSRSPEAQSFIVRRVAQAAVSTRW